MTSAFKLGLPTDIPWKRICFTDDMTDLDICDGETPPKWHSSIAVFQFEPEEEFQPHDDLTLSYLKVSVTLTGFHSREKELEGSVNFSNMESEEIKNLEDILNEYQPCSGAIVQVSVGPKKSDDTPVEAYPYFVDFEPKRRSLYELASETQQLSSRSLQQLNIGKSSASTESQEVLDIDMGWSAGVGVNAGKAGGGQLSFSKSGQWGTKSIGTDRHGSVSSSNSSDEKRETHSFTTQLSQLYNLLDSYHVGTNRAVFLMSPRPHVVPTESGFVRGPRSLDGIQEFFLVVATKKEEEYCVAVRLTSSHLAKMDDLDYDERQTEVQGPSVKVAPPTRQDPRAKKWMVEGTAEGIRRGQRVKAWYMVYSKGADSNMTWVVADRYPGYEIDTAKGQGGYTPIVSAAGGGKYSVSVAADGESLTATVDARATAMYLVRTESSIWVDPKAPAVHQSPGHCDLTLIVYLKSKNKIVPKRKTLEMLVTTRGLCCCGSQDERTTATDGVIARERLPSVMVQADWEKPTEHKEESNAVPDDQMPVDRSGNTQQIDDAVISPPVGDVVMTVNEANRLGARIQENLQATASSYSSTKPIPYIAHDYVAEKLFTRLRSSYSQSRILEKPLEDEDVLGLDLQMVEQWFGLPINQLCRHHLASLPLSELARFCTGDTKSAALRRLALLGVDIDRSAVDQQFGDSEPKDQSSGDA